MRIIGLFLMQLVLQASTYAAFPDSCPAALPTALPQVAQICSGNQSLEELRRLNQFVRVGSEAVRHTLQEKYYWQAAEEIPLSAAHCRRTKALPQRDMESFLDEWATSSVSESRSIQGINFVNESPQMLDLFEDLTKCKSTSELCENGVNSSIATKVGNCNQVKCALRKLFENGDGTDRNTGIMMAYMKAKYNANASHLYDEKYQNWKNSDLQRLMQVMDDMPPGTYPMFESNGRPKELLFKLRHFRDVREGDTQVANKVMEFNPIEWTRSLAIEDDPSILQRRPAWKNTSSATKVIFHELSHQFGGMSCNHNNSGGDVDQSKAWGSFSGGWSPNNKSFKIALSDSSCTTHAANHVSLSSVYGTCNPTEDFAESATLYRYNPTELWARSPEKYLFLKDNVFDGLEYVSEESCSSENSNSVGWQQDASIGNDLTSQAGFQCGDNFSSTMGANFFSINWNPSARSHPELFHCLRQKLSTLALAQGARDARATEWCTGVTEAGARVRTGVNAIEDASIVRAAAQMMAMVKGMYRQSLFNAIEALPPNGTCQDINNLPDSHGTAQGRAHLAQLCARLGGVAEINRESPGNVDQILGLQ